MRQDERNLRAREFKEQTLSGNINSGTMATLQARDFAAAP
jgi:hypothetical protein